MVGSGWEYGYIYPQAVRILKRVDIVNGEVIVIERRLRYQR